MEVQVNNKPTIRLISNSNNRLDILRPLLEFLVSKSMCKNDNGLYIVKSNLFPSQSTKEEKLFFYLQQDSAKKGFNYNCFNLRNHEKEEVHNTKEN